MILDRLVLKNFKRFRDEEIRFKDGITGILGNNGTGKSSLVQAIFFALYGVQATGIAPDYIVSSFASPKEKCEVRLDFRIGGDNYTVLRTFKKGKTVTHDASFHRNGNLMATGVSQVEEEVKRTIGMGPVDFRNTIYAGQKDLLTLLENTPGKRKEWFLRALGIDYLNAGSQKILKEQIDAKTSELAGMEGELRALTGRVSAEDIGALQASVVTSRQTIADQKQQQAGLLAQKTALAAELRQFSEKMTECSRLVERQLSLSLEIGGLEQQQARIRATLSALAAQEHEYRELEPGIAAYPGKKEQLEMLRSRKTRFDQCRAEQRFTGQRRADLTVQTGRTLAKIAVLDEDAKKIAALARSIREALSLAAEIPDGALETVFSTLQSEVLHATGTCAARQERLIAEERKLASDWDNIRNAGTDGTCPLCRQKLGSHYPGIEQEFTHQLEQIRDRAVEVCGEQERLTAEKSRIDAQKPAVSELRSLAEKQKTKAAIEAELAELQEQAKINELAQQALVLQLQESGFDEAEFARAEKEVAALEKVQARFNELGKKIAEGAVFRQQVSELGGQIVKKKADLAELTALIGRSSCDPEDGTRLEAVLAGTETALRNAESAIARTTERLSHAEEKIADYRKSEAAIALLAQQITGVKDEIELLKLTRTLIAEYVVYLMQVVRSRLEGEVSRIIGEITGGRYEQVLLDEDFNLLVRDVDDDYAIERFSGGEQDDIAVALRIALSRYLAELHQVHESTFLIFDEIFGSQDEERRNNLLVALRTQESRFPQILLISHIAEIQGEFANTLVVEMGSGLASTVREVE
ncbi:MAG: SMC family ATPase [Methanoregula sp.]|jgi:exonuclease SbcC|uniref:AAA family ATPase n=1 Tax=Methanoregula sp. TaxID=2052170 RepID=UPI003D0C98E3